MNSHRNEGRLLCTAPVFVVDLATGDRTIVSSEAVGRGPAFYDALGIAYDALCERLFVPDGSYGRLLVVDAASGDRALVSEAAPEQEDLP